MQQLRRKRDSTRPLDRIIVILWSDVSLVSIRRRPRTLWGRVLRDRVGCSQTTAVSMLIMQSSTSPGPVE